MLTRLQIDNFQAHKSFKLKLDRINVLVGRSDVGKSAVIRALRWLCTNKPGGDEFIRYGEESCSVKLKVDDQFVYRVRGKENLYYLNDEEYKAFGANVPTPVADLLNIDSVNFQDQHDAAFWFSESSGDVGKRLNSIVDLEVIDRVLSALAAKTRQSRSTCDVLKQQTKKAEEDVIQLAFVGEMVDQWNATIAVCNQEQELKEGVEYLAEMVDSIATYAQVMKRGGRVAVNFEPIAAIHNEINAIEKQCNDLKRLGKLIKDARDKARVTPPDISHLEKISTEITADKKQKSRLQELLEELKRSEKKRDNLSVSLVNAEMELEQCAQDVCPTCGQPIQINQKAM